MDIQTKSEELWQKVLQIWDHSLFKLGTFSVSLHSIVYLIGLLALLYFVSSRFRRFMMGRLAGYRASNPNVETVLSLAHYCILFLGAAVILNSAGLNLSALAVLAGAIGIGLGFGLQNIADNFISGLIIMFERPIKVGDRVDVGEITGQVRRIGMRSTTVLTNDNISTIIPNSKFVSDQVINWSHSGGIVRLRIPISVSYKSDPKHVVKILEEVISNSPKVYKEDRSDVILDSFGDSSINFTMRVWTRDLAKRPGALRHDINMAVWEAFKAEKIEIPYPQLDLHVQRSIASKSKHPDD